MPRRDKTGPLGLGPLTGRGLGPCKPKSKLRFGAGVGLGLCIGIALAKKIKSSFNQ